MFCDELQLTVIGGKGGDGAVSFRREKFIPRGGPDGGDGGNGGSIIFRVNPQLNTLGHLSSRKRYKADEGVKGAKKNMHGKNAKDLVLEVPEGTIIFNADKSEQIADLSGSNPETVIAKGGKGGLGNARFVSSTYQAPRFAENGEPGEEKGIILELKLVADVGIIGLPSAGKSTLISVISNARPKIAAYHFTTLTPNLGVVNMSKFGGSSTDSFVVADIPGLIEGASLGKGLGHQFLRHISRTKLLIHLIDCTLEDIANDYKTINKELKKFDKELARKDQIVVLNKIDMLDAQLLKKKSKEVKFDFAISALTREGLKPLLFAISAKLTELRKKELKKPKEEKDIPVLQPHLKQDKFKIAKIIRKENHKIFRITGARIEQLAIMTNTNNPEGLERIYHYLNKLGIQKTIEKAGATFGDFITIGEKKIPFRK